MSRLALILITLAVLIFATLAGASDSPNSVTWTGEAGPAKGKHIVFLAGDHEYRSEETLPALARIMAKSYGATCNFFVTTDATTGFINIDSNNMSGLEVLEKADLMVISVRFKAFPDEQMKYIADYLKRGGPVIGLRTATHGFKGLNPPYDYFNYDYKGEEFVKGFGRQILGESWAGHYGKNHEQSSRIILEPTQLAHPLLRGVENVHVQCGGYAADPMPNSVILGRGEVLNGMKIDDPADMVKTIKHPVAWVRTYDATKPSSRVFTTTHGASEDILNPGFRRMLINAQLWCLGLDDAITADGPIDFIGPYNPTTFNFNGNRQGVKPAGVPKKK
jgi:Trehalose utilisation